MSFDEALARTRAGYAIGLSGGRTAAGTPHEEASEAKGLLDRFRARGSRPGPFAHGQPHFRHDAARIADGRES